MTPRSAVAPFLLAAIACAQAPFSLDTVRSRARDLAARPHVPADVSDLPPWLAQLDFDGYRRIRARDETALWGGEDLPFRLQFSHRGYLFPARVPIHLVDGQKVEELRFHPDQFQYGLDVGGEIPATLGYAGVTILWHDERWQELASFRGASFFRLVGRGQRYGASARGLSIDTATPDGEEHPAFTEIWVERPLPGADRLTLYALLDSPALTGAYRFVLVPGDQCVAEVDAFLYLRERVQKLGLAPLSSMFLHGELGGRPAHDFRPERHDSDGLAFVDAEGRWSWRPLRNPDKKHRVSSFRLDAPAGFGLLQRDRAFAAYLDLEDRYELRPSMWIEPRGNWGEGTLELLEIPSDEVRHDNIACYWVPAQPPGAGGELAFGYTLSAFLDDPARPPLARARHTLVERNGGVSRFLIDFDGPQLRGDDAALRPEVSSSTGEVRNVVLQRNDAAGGMRLAFDVVPGDDVTELRASLWRDERQVTETWVLPWGAQL